MNPLFTGGLGDFIGAECFMSEAEKDSVKTVLWATRNRLEIKAAVDLKSIFPNMTGERVLFDDFCDERPTRNWQEGDRFMNIGRKEELNIKCKLNLSQTELDAISDHSLDATLGDVFAGKRKWESSRIATRMPLPDISKFNLPPFFVVIHPWSDAEINGREFNEHDWPSILSFLERMRMPGVIINKSQYPAPTHPNIIDLTNQTTLQESFAIIHKANYAIMCASSLACYATKIFPRDTIWLKGGFPHMFTDWATYFYHGPFAHPNDIIFKDLKVLDRYQPPQVRNVVDEGVLILL
jgi:hypothetical protein